MRTREKVLVSGLLAAVFLSGLGLGVVAQQRAGTISREEALIAAFKDMVHADRITVDYNETSNTYAVQLTWLRNTTSQTYWRGDEEYWRTNWVAQWQGWERLNRTSRWSTKEYWEQWGTYFKAPTVTVSRNGTLTYTINGTTGKIIEKRWVWETRIETTEREAQEAARLRLPGITIASAMSGSWRGRPVWIIQGSDLENHYLWIFHWTSTHQYKVTVDREDGQVLQIEKDGRTTYESTP